jgi:choline dehydrogenase-like flavoprotein
MGQYETDVIVIGSGFGAAPAALRLAEAGLRVVVLEKGPHIDPYRDFRQTQDPKYLLRYLKGVGSDQFTMTYAEGLGGGSGFYEMVSLRAPTLAFEQTDLAGRRLWPAAVDRKALDPYFDIGERMLQVRQLEPRQIPKSGLVFAQMLKNLGYSCDRAPYAVKGCVGSGRCVTGCIYGAKQSLLLNYIPQARAAGAEFHTDTEALEIRVRPTSIDLSGYGRLPYQYEILSRRTDGSPERVRYRARMVILGGGTVGTAKLLLQSQANLRDLSHHVGRHIAFNGGVKTACLLGDRFPDGDMYTGLTHPGMISYEFLETRGITIAAGKVLPLGAVAAARLRLDGEDPYWGEAHVELMQRFRHRVIALVAFGMTPPAGSIRKVGPERFRVELEVSDGLRAYYERTKQLLRSIMRRNDCTPLEVEFINREGMPYRDLHISTAHQVGSCRMSDSPQDGVCSAAGEVWGYPGLFIADGAAIPSSLAVNTSLTILANAERIVAGMLDRVVPVLRESAPALVAEGEANP